MVGEARGSLASRLAVERQLQETFFKFPWLVDCLNPWLGLHGLPALNPPPPLSELGCSPAQSSTWKRRSCRQRLSPQSDPQTALLPAVVSNGDTFSFLTPSVSLFTVDGDAADASVNQPLVQLASPQSEVSTPLFAPPPAATAPPRPAQPELEELSKPEELAPPEQDLSEQEEPAPLTEELSELEESALPEQELSEPERPAWSPCPPRPPPDKNQHKTLNLKHGTIT